jgi:hypothetical protein
MIFGSLAERYQGSPGPRTERRRCTRHRNPNRGDVYDAANRAQARLVGLTPLRIDQIRSSVRCPLDHRVPRSQVLPGVQTTAVLGVAMGSWWGQ